MIFLGRLANVESGAAPLAPSGPWYVQAFIEGLVTGIAMAVGSEIVDVILGRKR